ncbi:hypothetical protein N6L24_02660 [Cognatishimia sp. SS12]|uniref:hypothetical protein n=1 Tax=Cognatishimia sp. SS12 TaxID=2979465 RepID=UPI0023305DEC|nr:hypothetical protein [Cognatishimia sp. SS12]MDC0737174.1 hypothetical protein [Cognatishimia sp. SS12]
MVLRHADRRKSSCKDHSRRHAQLFALMRQQQPSERTEIADNAAEAEAAAMTAFRDLACASLRF